MYVLLYANQNNWHTIMRTLKQLTASETIGYNAIVDMIKALEYAKEKTSAFLEANPQGCNLHVTVLNCVYTIGLEADGKTLKLNNRLESVGYDFETAVAIKRSFKGKDGMGREIKTSEITVRNARKYMLELYNDAHDRSDQMQKALTDLLNRD